MQTYESLSTVPPPVNESVRFYAPGDGYRQSLQEKLKSLRGEIVEIPCVIAGREIRTGHIREVVMPHRHQTVLARVHLAGAKELELAVQAAHSAKADWALLSWNQRVSIFLKAATLLAGPYRDVLNASTMLGQSKNAFQAEIDAACELIDFFRFNSYFYQSILQAQPDSLPGVWNQMEYRPLEGFVAAITPFNFTSIAANLCAAPAMLGNTVIWKPSDTQLYSAWFTMKLFEEAGLPPGVINFVPSDGPLAGEVLLKNENLGGIHFTGSTQTFDRMLSMVGESPARYRAYPRVVGETGGKDFIFADFSADPDALITALIRGAFEYQGQKCSAASRAYIPESIWKKIKEPLISEVKTITLGDPEDFDHFMNAVIDERAFKKITSYIAEAKASAKSTILVGGGSDSSVGYFVEPTIIQCSDVREKTMVEEIFGPVLSVFVYPDDAQNEALKACDQGSPYALTGAVFAQDRYAVQKIASALRNTAGNFYINDKPTGAVVGQQPFGGARRSGTNDKAGSVLNLYRWLSPRVVKENFNPPRNYRYY